LIEAHLPDCQSAIDELPTPGQVLLPELMTIDSKELFSDIDFDDAALAHRVVLFTWPSQGYRLYLSLRREGLPLDFSTIPNPPNAMVERKKHGWLRLSFKR
jgi:hypothetical protein